MRGCVVPQRRMTDQRSLMTEHAQESLWPEGWNRADLLPTLLRCQRHVPALRADVPSALGEYLTRLHAAAKSNEFLDVTLGGLIVDAVRQIHANTAQLDDFQRQWLHTAVAYLLNANDAVHDFTAIDGLDDDADVVLALLDALRLTKLSHPIRTHLRR